MLPKIPTILLSIVNTKLRDHYQDLDALCQDLEVDKAWLIDKLRMIDYEYDAEINQFV